jgi:riboflavin transporter FmnP
LVRRDGPAGQVVGLVFGATLLSVVPTRTVPKAGTTNPLLAVSDTVATLLVVFAFVVLLVLSFLPGYIWNLHTKDAGIRRRARR